MNTNGNQPDDELERILDGEDALHALLGDLDRGTITLREFQLSLDSHAITQSHPCIEPGCTHSVPFDDEPRCFTHSPDEGSSVRGYSYLVSRYLTR